MKIIEITNQEDEQSDFINYSAYCILLLINNSLEKDNVVLEPNHIIDHSFVYIDKKAEYPDEYYMKVADNFVKKIK